MTNPTPIRATMIDTRDLQRTFKTRGGTGRGRRRGRPARERGRDLRLPRPERGGQDHHPADAGDPASARPRGEARVAGVDLRREPQLVRAADRLRPAGRLDGSGRDRPRRARPPGPALRDERQPTPRRARPRSSPRSTWRPPPTARPAPTPAACAAGSTSGSGIVHRPQVLFLDEPTTGLDPQARARMWDEIRNLRELGTTVFLTTHYLEEADALCDRLAIIDHGRIVAEGTSDPLKRRSPATS